MTIYRDHLVGQLTTIVITRGVDVWFVVLEKPKLNWEEGDSAWSGVQR